MAGDGVCQDSSHSIQESFTISEAQSFARRARVHSCSKKGFIGINIPNARNDMLIEERCFQGPAVPRNASSKLFRCKLRIERFHS
jgi:hypothetical protein